MTGKNVSGAAGAGGNATGKNATAAGAGENGTVIAKENGAATAAPDSASAAAPAGKANATPPTNTTPAQPKNTSFLSEPEPAPETTTPSPSLLISAEDVLSAFFLQPDGGAPDYVQVGNAEAVLDSQTAKYAPGTTWRTRKRSAPGRNNITPISASTALGRPLPVWASDRGSPAWIGIEPRLCCISAALIPDAPAKTSSEHVAHAKAKCETLSKTWAGHAPYKPLPLPKLRPNLEILHVHNADRSYGVGDGRDGSVPGSTQGFGASYVKAPSSPRVYMDSCLSNRRGSWMPRSSCVPQCPPPPHDPYVELDLGAQRELHGVVLAGRPRKNQWVERVEIEWEIDHDDAPEEDT